MDNQSEVREFILLGLTNDRGQKHVLFTPFLFCYMTCLLGNLIFLTVVLSEPRLHTPMYFFLGNLSCIDIIYTTTTVPRMLSDFLIEFQPISFVGCFTQLHFFHFMGCTEAILLAVMALDRYVAICNPLRYTVIMNKWTCLTISFCIWMTGFSYGALSSVLTSKLIYCGPNHIQHFMCDIKPLLKLACCNTDFNLALLNIATGFTAFSAFLFVLVSYFFIISFLFYKMKSWQSRWKAFSTCASHLTVVILHLFPVCFNYIFASVTESIDRDIRITVIYSAVTPVLNPIIYTLRNREVITAVRKLFCRKWLFGSK